MIWRQFLPAKIFIFILNKQIDGEKLCGKFKPNSILTFEFSSHQKDLLFKSDSGRNRKGFLILGEQKECDPFLGAHPIRSSIVSDHHHGLAEHSHHPPSSDSTIIPLEKGLIHGHSIHSLHSQDDEHPSNTGQQYSTYSPLSQSICEYCFTDQSGEMTSYSFPKDYPPNMFCRYKFNSISNNFCSLEIAFESFEIESSSKYGIESETCSKDFFEMNSIKYCGDQLAGVKSKSYDDLHDDLFNNIYSLYI